MQVATDKTGIIGSTLYQPEMLSPKPQYEYYAPLLMQGYQHIDTRMFTNIDILNNHFFQILAIMQDGIETRQVQNALVYVNFVDGEVVKLSVFDYWFNLIFWGLPVTINAPITSKYLWFTLDIDQDSIADYINNFIQDNCGNYSNIMMNNMIDDVMFRFQFIDKFSLFLYNTANNEDTLDLMKSSEVFNNAIHCDLSKVDISEVKDTAQKITNEGIEEIIKSHKHWAEPYFRSKQGINKKQFRELMFNIATIPNDEGSVYQKIINGNFCNRAITDPVDYLIEARKSRRAQILGHQNVGISGAFARILGLNNVGETLNRDPNYICRSKNFIEIDIKDRKTLNLFKNRYYRLSPNGVEKKISQQPLKYDKDLIGKHLYIRSPITCASRAHGNGICYRCYGGLAKTNADINIGTIAAEILSSLLTQRLLSAKHLLESYVRQLKWCKYFSEFFELNFNTIRLKEDEDYKKFKIIIRQDDIFSDDEDDNDGEAAAEAFQFDKYITMFTVVDPKGVEYNIKTDDFDNMYFTIEMDKIIKKKPADADGIISIPLDELKGKNLFFITVINDGLSSTLEQIKHIINRDSDVKALATKDKVTQELIDTVIKGGLPVDAVHLEVLLANQCVSEESPLIEPAWEYADAKYRMVTLNERLKDNPSVCVSFMNKDIKKQLFYPLTFMKSKANPMDLFYMISPQNYMGMKPTESNIISDKEEVGGLIKPITFLKPIEEVDTETIED